MPEKTSITEFAVDALDNPGEMRDYWEAELAREDWQYGGDAEHYKYFRTEQEAKDGLVMYLRERIADMEKLIEQYGEKC